MEAIDPARLLDAALRKGLPDISPDEPVNVIAAGKAAWGMTTAFARGGYARAASGLVSGPRVSGEPLPRGFEWVAGGHPAPSDASERAGRLALALARHDPRVTLVVLLSGGASAMLAVPAEGITLDDKRRTAALLMRAGVSIHALNCVRKHLSAMKGGQLGASVERSVTLAISDVHGPVEDDPSVIGSGPTVPDPSTFGEALAVVRGLPAETAAQLPRPVVQRLELGARGRLDETPKPGDPRLRGSTFHVIGTRRVAMDAAAAAARALGYAVQVLPEATAGDARVAGERFAHDAARICESIPGGACVIASGEPTVRVRGTGRGGRNQEFAIGMAHVLATEFDRPDESVIAVSAGTDGIDGPTDAAGAVVDSSTLARAARAGLDANDTLARNDAYPFFQRLDDLLMWGPTGTNVGDLHVVLRRREMGNGEW